MERAVIDSWAQTRVKTLTLEQKAGQMIVAGLPGTALTSDVASMVRRCHFGGVMLWDVNIESPEQVAGLVDDLQQLALADAGLPLFVSIDHEGGAVSRLKWPATALPSAMAVAATGSLDHARSWARVIGQELRALGVNVDYAPVLDVNSEPANPVIGIRSFGDSPVLVADMGVAVIQSLHECGLMATAKHFPGHGGSAVDSHLDLPIINRSRQLVYSQDLPPFGAAINAGVDTIMTAHAVYPALANDRLPATMSREILTGLLRDRMGFQGLIITDALVMRAVTSHLPLAEAAVLSIRAGADLVLTLAAPDEQIRVFEEIVRATRQGRISEAALDDSVARILMAKARLPQSVAAPGANGNGSDLARWPIEEHRTVARSIARDSITLLRNLDHLLPLREGERIGLVEFAPARFCPVEDRVCGNGLIRGLFQERDLNVSHLRLDPAPRGAEPVLGTFIDECDVVVVVTRNAHLVREQGAMVRRILDAGRPTVVVAVRSPYDVLSFPSVGTYLASYGDTPASLEAAVSVLFGHSQPRGKLPVSIGNVFPRGCGLEGFE